MAYVTGYLRDRNRRRGRSLAIGLLLSAVLIGTGAGCGADEEAEIAWTNDDVSVEGRVTSYQGLSFCDQESVTILGMEWPLTSTAPPQNLRTYVRDTEGVFAAISKSRFGADVTIPAIATDTGFSSRYGNLWIDQDMARVVYVRGKDRVEAWPRTDHVVGCD